MNQSSGSALTKKMKTLVVLVLAVLALTQAVPVRVNPEEGEYFEGDIMNEDYRHMLGKNGIIDERYRWLFNGTSFIVPYVYDSSQPISEEIRNETVSVFADYARITNNCILFIPRTDEDDYISFYRGGGCSSYIGRIGGKQEISYADGCSRYGTVQHEMYHALGFYHEQSRTDRDSYVTINFDNIQLGYAGNFVKYDADTISPFGESYDYLSVMHYPRDAFSKNGQDTITTTDEDYQDQIGQRVFLSDTDVAKLNKMYVCS